MQQTRCKFLCTSVTKRSAAGYYTTPKVEFLFDATFQVVTSGSEENKKFFASTPTGQLTFSSINGDQFEPNKEYFIDITAAE